MKSFRESYEQMRQLGPTGWDNLPEGTAIQDEIDEMRGVRRMRNSSGQEEVDTFDLSQLTDQQIIDRAEGLAREIHRSKGYEVPDDYVFHDSINPRATESWNLAVIAFEYLTGTDLTDALAGIEEVEE